MDAAHVERVVGEMVGVEPQPEADAVVHEVPALVVGGAADAGHGETSGVEVSASVVELRGSRGTACSRSSGPVAPPGVGRVG